MKTPRLHSLLAAAACLLAVLICARTAAARVSASAAPLDLPAFAAQLKHCASALGTLRHDSAGIPRFRRSLPVAWEVRAGGETFRVSTAWLDSALAQIQKKPAGARLEWRQIQDRLDFLRAQAEALERPAAGPSRAQARESLDAIFRQRQFRGLAGPGPLQLWWLRLLDRIDRGIDWLLARLHLSAVSGNLLAYGLIAIALLFLLFWGWRNIAGRKRRTEAQTSPVSGEAEARIWASEALAAADRGEFREAIHCAYWAAVARMEELGAIPANRSRTPREMLRSIASGSTASEPFRELTEKFELVWYGYRLPSPADWQNTRTQMERIGCLGFSTPQTAGS
jgi:hypothetical protein